MNKLFIGLLLSFSVIITSCSRHNVSFNCSAINSSLNPTKQYTELLPWIDFSFNNIATIKKSKNMLSCHAVLNLKDKTNATMPPSIDYTYDMYLADNKNDITLITEEDKQKSILSHLISYAFGARKIIKDYRITSDGKGLYIIVESENYANHVFYSDNLIFNSRKLLHEQFIDIEKTNYKIDGEDTYIISYSNGGNCAGCGGIFIVQIDKFGESASISDSVSASPEYARQESNTIVIPGGKYINYIYKSGKILTQNIHMPDKIFADYEFLNGSLYFEDIYQNNSKFRSKIKASLKKIGAFDLYWIPGGVQSQVRLVVFETDKMILSSLCEPHNCGNNKIDLLYSQRTNQLTGVYVNDGKVTFFGDYPTQLEEKLLRNVANQ